jgi:hypothetical protein
VAKRGGEIVPMLVLAAQFLIHDTIDRGTTYPGRVSEMLIWRGIGVALDWEFTWGVVVHEFWAIKKPLSGGRGAPRELRWQLRLIQNVLTL